MRIYVGNLSFETTQAEVRDLFGKYGGVGDVSLITDRDTGQPKGFGFVDMSDDASARKALEALDGFELGGRKLKVNEARAREERGTGGGWRR